MLRLDTISVVDMYSAFEIFISASSKDADIVVYHLNLF